MRNIIRFAEFIKESSEQKDLILSETKDSQILDKNGKLLKVYKTSEERRFNTIIPDDCYGFTTSKKAALGFGKDINEYVLYLKKPLYMTNYGKDSSMPEEWMTWLDVKERFFSDPNPYVKMMKEGYDCFIELNDKRLGHITAFDEILYPNNITVFDLSKVKKLGGLKWYEV